MISRTRAPKQRGAPHGSGSRNCVQESCDWEEGPETFRRSLGSATRCLLLRGAGRGCGSAGSVWETRQRLKRIPPILERGMMGRQAPGSLSSAFARSGGGREDLAGEHQLVDNLDLRARDRGGKAQAPERGVAASGALILLVYTEVTTGLRNHRTAILCRRGRQSAGWWGKVKLRPQAGVARTPRPWKTPRALARTI